MEIENDLNDCQILRYYLPSSSSIEEFNLDDSTDCCLPVDVDFNMDLSLIGISCQIFPKGCFHDPIADFLKDSYWLGPISHGLFLYLFN